VPPGGTRVRGGRLCRRRRPLIDARAYFVAVSATWVRSIMAAVLTMGPVAVAAALPGRKFA
jgi:hypothetical protein